MTTEPIVCGLCGFKNAPDVRFCGGCGEPVTEMRVEEERKEVAILFADICNFTELVATHDPEETKDKIEECLRVMANRVVAMNGVVEKFIGDSIMAVFGVPAIHENDAELAVRAGIQIVENARNYGLDANLSLEVRVGVHFGEVIVTKHSPAPGRAHHVFGNAVNVASRLEATGIVGAVVISEKVYKKTKGFFTYEELPSIKVKGVQEELRRYRVIGEREIRGKIRGIPGLTSTMIGRKKPLELLQKTYREVSQGNGARVVTIVGEAGIGKTRLVEELLLSLKQSGHAFRVFHGRCLGYSGAPTYYPFAEIAKKALGVKEDMPPAEIAARLAVSVERIFGSSKIGDIDTAGILAEILALGRDDDRLGGRDTKQIHNQVLIVFEKLIHALANETNIVLLIEDVQWADNSSLTLIGHLARTLGGARCLLVLNSRPPLDQEASLSLLEELKELNNHIRIDLKDLTPENTRRLVSQLLTVEKLSEEKRRAIVELASGNPFFVEEIIKVLIEKGYLEHRGGTWIATEGDSGLGLPDTVEGVLRSRIDNLPLLEKKVIQRASVVGEVFWRRIVAELMDTAIEDYLVGLEKRDLIHRRLESLFEDDLEYIFKHMLLHETVYKSLLHRERRQLHLKTAEWIERNYADRIQAYEPLIAHHFERGDSPKKAAGYYLLAGERAASLYANEDAKRFFSKAVTNAEDGDLARRSYLGWGNVCYEIGDNREAVDHFTNAMSHCRSDLERAQLLVRMGESYEHLSDYPVSLEHFDEAEELIEREPASLLHGQLNTGKAWVHYLRGDFEEALRLIVKAGEVLRGIKREDFTSDMVRARASSVRATVLTELDRTEEAHRYYQHTLELYEKHGYLFGMCSILNNIGTTKITAGRYGAAIELLTRSYEIGTRCGDRFGLAVNCNNLGEVYSIIGDYDKAEDYLTQYEELNAIITNRLGDGYVFDGFAFLNRKRKEFEKAKECYFKSIEVFEELGSFRNALNAKMNLATLYADFGREEESRALFERIHESVDEERTILHRLKALAVTARRRDLTNGELKGLTGFLGRAEHGFENEPQKIDRAEAGSHLAQLYGLIGSDEKAERYGELAHKLFNEIAEDLNDDGLKKTFLTLKREQGFLP